jgi:hypothetical protein
MGDRRKVARKAPSSILHGVGEVRKALCELEVERGVSK